MKSVSGSVSSNSVIGTVGAKVWAALSGQTSTVMMSWLTGTLDVAMIDGFESAAIVSACDGSPAAARDWSSIQMAQSPTTAARIGFTSHSPSRPKSIHERTCRIGQRSRPVTTVNAVIASWAPSCCRQVRR